MQCIEKFHRDFEVTLKIGKEEVVIECGCRIIQGHNIPPTIFIILTQRVAEKIVNDLVKEKIEIPMIKYVSDGNGIFRLCGQNEVSKMLTETINMLAYVDEGAITFN